MPDFFTLSHRQLIVTLAERHRLPSIYAFRVFTAPAADCFPTELIKWKSIDA